MREGHLSIRKAAAKFKLGDHLIRKVPRQAKMGRQPAIPLEVEDKIAQCATENARKGFGVGRKEVMLRAGRVCKTSIFNFTVWKPKTVESESHTRCRVELPLWIVCQGCVDGGKPFSFSKFCHLRPLILKNSPVANGNA